MAGSKEVRNNDLTFTAGEDLSGALNLVVTIDGASADNTVLIADALGEVPVGVLVDWLDDGTSGDTVTVAGPGSIVKVKCGGTVTRGKRVKVDTGDEGKIINSAGGSAALFGILGTALETGADGDLVLVLINPGTDYYAS